MRVDFSRRAEMLEMMDDPGVDFDTWRACLVDLAKVNRLTLAYRPTLAFLQRLLDEGRWPKDRPVVILDVGSGYADTLRQVAKWARARSLDVRLQALDMNPWSEKAAERVEGSAGIQFISENLFDHQGRRRHRAVVPVHPSSGRREPGAVPGMAGGQRQDRLVRQ